MISDAAINNPLFLPEKANKSNVLYWSFLLFTFKIYIQCKVTLIFTFVCTSLHLVQERYFKSCLLILTLTLTIHGNHETG